MRCGIVGAVVCLVAGCEGGMRAADAARDTEAAADTSPGDASADVPDVRIPEPELPDFCGACRRDSDCGEGNRCIYLLDGARGCGRPCATTEECRDQLGREDVVCAAELSSVTPQCRPLSDECIETPVGTRCAGSEDCRGRFNRCTNTDGLGRTCTMSCRVDADCPDRFRRCRVVDDSWQCVRDDESAPERCSALRDAGAALRAPMTGSCAASEVLEYRDDGSAVCVPNLRDPDDWATRLQMGDCDCDLASVGSALDEALGATNASRCDMAFPSSALATSPVILPNVAFDRFRLSITRRATYWPTVERFAEWLERETATRSANAAESPARLLELAMVADLQLAPPATAPASGLRDALEAFSVASGSAVEEAVLDQAVRSLDPALAERIAPIVHALARALEERNTAIARVSADADRYYLGGPGLNAYAFGDLDVTRRDVQAAFLGDIDIARMTSATRDLADAIARADLARYEGPVGELTLDTSAGRIAVRGRDVQTYRGDEWSSIALLVDFGGADVYLVPAGANASVANGVSVVIDVGGADRYAYDERLITLDLGPPGSARLPSDTAGRYPPDVGEVFGPFSRSRTSRQGAGRLGIGLLFDLGGADDTYRSLRASQGYAAFGVGVLFDDGGNDSYTSEMLAQGAASGGIGLLIDAGGGRDRYTTYHDAQGFGGVRGFGMLVDMGGDDVYLAPPRDVLYPANQDAGANASFVQGAGFGRRDDVPGGVSMSGGVGALVDLGGSDSYTAGVFAQGTGYWYGTGVLVDVAGDDTYDAQWYAQSGNAHFAVSAFRDRAGNDRYDEHTIRQNAVLGGGHDFSIAWFRDDAGNDIYTAPNFTLGGGSAGGAGVFIDDAGDDIYSATSAYSLGNASIQTPETSSIRYAQGTWGFFFDLGGSDRYTRPVTIGSTSTPRDEAVWTQEVNPGHHEHGVGFDRARTRLGLAPLRTR